MNFPNLTLLAMSGFAMAAPPNPSHGVKEFGVGDVDTIAASAKATIQYRNESTDTATVEKLVVQDTVRCVMSQTSIELTSGKNAAQDGKRAELLKLLGKPSKTSKAAGRVLLTSKEATETLAWDLKDGRIVLIETRNAPDSAEIKKLASAKVEMLKSSGRTLTPAQEKNVIEQMSTMLFASTKTTLKTKVQVWGNYDALRLGRAMKGCMDQPAACSATKESPFSKAWDRFHSADAPAAWFLLPEGRPAQVEDRVAIDTMIATCKRKGVVRSMDGYRIEAMTSTPDKASLDAVKSKLKAQMLSMDFSEFGPGAADMAKKMFEGMLTSSVYPVIDASMSAPAILVRKN